MSKWVRSGVIEGAPELVAELGGDYRALARETGLPIRPMDRPDLPIPVESFVRFLDLAAARLGEEAFGLRLGRRQTLGLFGPMEPLLASAATVGVILQDLADYFPLHTQGTIVGLSHGEDGHLLTYELAVGTGPQQRQVIELGFGVLLGELARHVRGWVPPLVFMRHGPPANRTWHRRLFGEHVIYNADRNGMLVETAVLARPTVAGNRAVHDPLVAQFGAAARTATGIEALRTEALVRAMLPFAPVNLAICARMLRLSRRTLQRQLETQGTSFNAILDQVRAGLALSYLVESSLTAAQVAEILQFSETSALSRAVRRWYGICPRAVRSQARQPG